MTLDKHCFVLVHGAWHDASCWQHLLPRLETLGHTVLCPDLPGHGKHAAGKSRVTLSTYCDAIADVIDQSNTQVILVGHSMSGMVISQVAERMPDKIRRLVYLCAYLPCNNQSLFDVIAANRDHEAAAPVESAMHMSADKRRCTISPGDIRPLFYNRCPDHLAANIPAELPAQATLPLSGKVTLDASRFGRVPKTYICCLDDQVIPVKHQRRMLTRQSCDEMIQLDADHSPFLSCPDTLALVLSSAGGET